MAKLAEGIYIDSETMARKENKSKPKFVIEREQKQAQKYQTDKEKANTFLVACGILDENGEITDAYKGVFTKENDD
ncbi:MAG: hypothetical protein K2O41_00675 [Clostridia bacterium]|nr:hypothetical protein [Clostridia bacterium]